jgi:plastocyanin domain-containing protein
MRKDPSPCAEAVLIPGLKISESLPLNKLKTIQLPAMATGEYKFHCQMNMIQGKISVQ